MFKTELKYKDFLDNEKTTTLRFNLSETELLDLTRHDPVFSSDYLAYVVAEQNVMMMVDVIRKIIEVSYGELSEDGNMFKKSPQLLDDFKHSAMYDALIDQLLATEDFTYLKNFIMGVFPAKYASEIAKLSLENVNASPELSVVPTI